MDKLKQYIKNVLVSLDQLVNTLAAGDPDETISSRAGKRVNTCRFCFYLCKALDYIDPRHCKKSIEKDEGSKGIWH